MEQRTQEWHDARLGKITASVVGAILGIDPYRNAGDILRMMVRQYHGAPREFDGNFATEYGTNHEPIAKLDYQTETGNLIEDCGFVSVDWIGASPDGFVSQEKLVEIKCPYGKRNDNPVIFRSINYQPHYYAQMQIQMYCTSAYLCDFYQWSPHGTMLETVGYDTQWIAENLPKLEEFYKRYLSEIDNPIHLQPRTQVISTETVLLDDYDDVCAQIDELTEKKRDLLAAIVDLAGGQDSIINGRKLTKIEKQGVISYAKAIKEIAPDADLEPWRGEPTSYWKLT